MLSFVTKWRVVIDLSRFRIEKYSLFKNFQGTLELKGFVVFEIVMLLFTLNKSWKQLNSRADFTLRHDARTTRFCLSYMRLSLLNARVIQSINFRSIRNMVSCLSCLSE